ncbi:hypothetical protein KY360_01590 [Candidatus Woesearchaeota archaeon]|nr:hypothetical protein [Candidatus Woesearchaeota archaeon]
MVKIHTRVKRKFGMRARFSRKNPLRVKQSRPKTFITEAKAKEYAVKQKLKEDSYSIVPAKKGKKFKIETK